MYQQEVGHYSSKANTLFRIVQSMTMAATPSFGRISSYNHVVLHNFYYDNQWTRQLECMFHIWLWTGNGFDINLNHIIAFELSSKQDVI